MLKASEHIMKVGELKIKHFIKRGKLDSFVEILFSESRDRRSGKCLYL